MLNINVFNEVLYKSDQLKGCFFSLVFSIVQHFEKKIDLFLLNDIYYYTNQEGRNRLSLISKSDIDWIDIIKKLHIILDARVYCSNLVSEMRKAIQNGMPVIISVDGFYLSFAREEGHISRYVIVEGYNEENDSFNILVQKRSYDIYFMKYVISSQELKEAYEGYMFLYHTIHKINEGMDFPTFYSFFNTNNYSIDTVNSIIEYKKYVHKNIGIIHEGLNIICEFVNRLIKEEMELNYEEFIQDINNIIAIRRVELYVFKNIVEIKFIESTLYKLIWEWEKIRFIIIRAKMKSLSNDKIGCIIMNKLIIIMELEKRYFNSINKFSTMIE